MAGSPEVGGDGCTGDLEVLTYGCEGETALVERGGLFDLLGRELGLGALASDAVTVEVILDGEAMDTEASA